MALILAVTCGTTLPMVMLEFVTLSSAALPLIFNSDTNLYLLQGVGHGHNFTVTDSGPALYTGKIRISDTEYIRKISKSDRACYCPH